MVIHLEKKMERLNSGDEQIVFGTKLRILDIGLMKASTKDLLETRLEKRIGFRTCSTTRRTS